MTLLANLLQASDSFSTYAFGLVNYFANSPIFNSFLIRTILNYVTSLQYTVERSPIPACWRHLLTHLRLLGFRIGLHFHSKAIQVNL